MLSDILNVVEIILDLAIAALLFALWRRDETEKIIVEG